MFLSFIILNYSRNTKVLITRWNINQTIYIAYIDLGVLILILNT